MRYHSAILSDPRRREPVLLGILLGTIVLTRFPLLTLGYGADGDAWRVAHSAWTFWTTGQYTVSRFPGFPLYESLMAPFVGRGGPLFANAATLLAYLLAVLSWRSVTLRTARHPGLIVAAFALFPIIIVSAACTMDYLWSLLCILLAIRSAQHGNVIAAGIWTGLAAAFRLPNIVAALPVGVLLYSGTMNTRRPGMYFVCTIVAVAAGFLPVLLTYGIRGWLEGMDAQIAGTSITLPDHLLLGVYRGVFALGLIPGGVALVILLRKRKRVFPRTDPMLRSALAGIMTFSLLFFLFPFQREYLIPAIPFFLIIIDHYANSTWMMVFIASIVSYAIVNVDVVRHHDLRGDPGISVRPGLLIEELQDRRALIAERASLPRLHFSSPTMVMTGLDDAFTFENEELVEDTTSTWSTLHTTVFRSQMHPATHFISVLDKDEVTHLMNAHVDIYYQPARRAYIQSIAGYDLDDAGIKSLPGD